MTKPNLKVVRSPERQALAEAIERHAEAQRRLEELNAAQDRCGNELMASRIALTKSKEALEEAKRDKEPEVIVAEFLGQGATQDPVAEIERDIETGSAEVDRLTRAHDALAKVQHDADDRETFSAMTVRQRLQDVVAAEGHVARLFERYIAAQRQLAELHHVLSFLDRKNLVRPEQRAWDSLREFPDLNADAPWQAAVAELERDPDAKLPV